jgi:molecular chaperone GrpE
MENQKEETNAEEYSLSTEPEQAYNQPEIPEIDDTEKLRIEVKALKDQLLRKVAEFENYRRRTREEQINLIQFANEGLIIDLLPVLDDFNRSLTSGIEHPDFESFYSGIEIIRNKLVKALELRGLQKMDIIGKHFNVDFHDALLQIPDPVAKPGIILNEIEPGYTLNDKVIRHAKVTVAAQAQSENEIDKA